MLQKLKLDEYSDKMDVFWAKDEEKSYFLKNKRTRREGEGKGKGGRVGGKDKKDHTHVKHH